MSLRDTEASHKAKLQLDGLKIQAGMQRKNTSTTIKDLITYISNNQQHDKLVFPDRDNPFKQKKSCTVL